MEKLNFINKTDLKIDVPEKMLLIFIDLGFD